MGDIIDTLGAFKPITGIVICLACGWSFGTTISGLAKLNEIECFSCKEEFSAFIPDIVVQLMVKKPTRKKKENIL